MSSFRLPATFGSVAEFCARLQEIEPSLGCDELVEPGLSPLARACEIDGHTLANRWAVHPMEGWDGTEDGNPSEDTLRRWYRFGLSGAALVWGGEAYAVCPQGRANPNQLHQGSCEDPVAGLKALMAALRRGQAEAGLKQEQALVGLQLTHSGRWSQPTAAGPAPRTMFRQSFLDQKVGIEDDSALLADEELQELPALYAAAALSAEAAGFNFVDIKCCHGYLLHECLAATSRPGPYGGSFENRTRLFREIVAAVREACPDLLVGVRLSVTDERDHGFGVQEGDKTSDNLDEPFAFLRLLQQLNIRLVNQTIGSPYYCPHVQRPAAFAPSDGAPPTRDPLVAVAKHLLLVRRCKNTFPEMMFVGTGYTYLQEYTAHVAEFEVGNQHVDFVGLGRMMLSYPEMPADHLAGKRFQRKKICRTFSDCTTGPRNGMRSGCYPLDPEYRQRPEAKKVRALRPTPSSRKGT
ncbi:MAG: NADH:flavin oxidoreductase [Planctomycetota bacterium]|jgi:2,4-dienoyl-CoA reductase-like NADH-dependent reductase (Old Yellow Enzyme family)|nr:NADH:flavin oxidoreductase [Planctomycetota bacterium]